MERKFDQMKGKGPDVFPEVPENYFKDLPDRVIGRIREKKNERKAFFLQPAFVSVAAGLIILFGIGLLFLLSIPNQEAEIIAENQHVPVETEQVGSEMFNTDSADTFFYPEALNNQGKVSEADDPTEGVDDLFTMLDEIPIDVIIDYLIETEELLF